MNEQTIKTVAKLYQMRDTARRFFKDEWPAKQREWRPIIEAAMEQDKIGELEAAMKICKVLSEADQGFSVIVVMGTVCEMIEPTNPLS
jgi:2-succinyl-5-enolpyruvyl-6-hydroxy-3-cyclohexene-1-carboxylate synthase